MCGHAKRTSGYGCRISTSRMLLFPTLASVRVLHPDYLAVRRLLPPCLHPQIEHVMCAWGLRLRRVATCSRCCRTLPCCLPASLTPSAPIPPPSHGSGSGGFAAPFLYDSFIHYLHYFTPAYPMLSRQGACATAGKRRGGQHAAQPHGLDSRRWHNHHGTLLLDRFVKHVHGAQVQGDRVVPISE